MKRFKGQIVSDKMDKTVVVQVTRLKKHPIYERRYKVTKKYKVHDPENSHKMGETVMIEQTRPISKDKRWQILERQS